MTVITVLQRHIRWRPVTRDVTHFLFDGRTLFGQPPTNGEVFAANLELSSGFDLDVDLGVEGVHDGERQEEVEDGGDELESGVGGVLGVADVWRNRPHTAINEMMPRGDGNEPQTGNEPRISDQNQGATLCALAQVFERRRDAPVSIQTQDEQVENGGGAGDVVDTCKKNVEILRHSNRRRKRSSKWFLRRLSRCIVICWSNSNGMSATKLDLSQRELMTISWNVRSVLQKQLSSEPMCSYSSLAFITANVK